MQKGLDMEKYNKYLDGELKYIIDNCKKIIKLINIKSKKEDAGFCIISQNKSFFYPAKCIVHLQIHDNYLKNGKEIMKHIIENNKIELAIGTSEDIKSLVIFLDYHKSIKPVAIGFEHGEIINKIEIPGEYEIKKAKIKDIQMITRIWKDIFEHYHINLKENIEELKRTEKQIKNNNVWYISNEKEVVGFGAAHFQYITNNKVEIGFAVSPLYWKKGFGTLLAKFLKVKCQENGNEAIAHCNYYHEASKKTLEKAGMIAKHRKYEFTF